MLDVTGKDVDVVVFGGGFAGSLTALILAAQGRRVVLLERDTHPRFAIGESSTPMANLVLESLCDRYGLSAVRPLTRYGKWSASYPDVRKGLKRGFTFFDHTTREAFRAHEDHRTELAVAANPGESVGDTHWLRSDVDHFFIREAERGGVEVHEGFSIHRIEPGRPWLVLGGADDVSMGFNARYVIDATGPSGLIAPYVGAEPKPVRTSSRAMYSHFAGVPPFADVAPIDTNAYPYPPDAAAVHHVLGDSWMWALRFDHGVTSLGMMIPDSVRVRSAEDEWTHRIDAFPTIAAQLRDATPLRPITLTDRIQRRWDKSAGRTYAMLPHTAYFVDPLLSAGIAHSMVGIERLARAFEAWPNHEAVGDRFAQYDRQLQADIDVVDMLVAGAYRLFSRFDLLVPWLMYYFSAAIQGEERRRTGTHSGEDGFLLSHDPRFTANLRNAFDVLREAAVEGFSRDLGNRWLADITPYDTVGLCDAGRLNMHPYA